MTKITVSFWGQISDPFGASRKVELDGLNTVADLRKALGDDILNSTIRAVINGSIVKDNTPISDGDTVEFLSPVGGG